MIGGSAWLPNGVVGSGNWNVTAASPTIMYSATPTTSSYTSASTILSTPNG